MDYEATGRLLEALVRSGVARFKCTEFEVEFGAPLQSGLSAGDNQKPREAAPAAPTEAPKAPAKAPEPGTAGAAPPVEIEIPHQVNQVRSLLRLGDYELAERLFPDYTQPAPEAPGAKEA